MKKRLVRRLSALVFAALLLCAAALAEDMPAAEAPLTKSEYDMTETVVAPVDEDGEETEGDLDDARESDDSPDEAEYELGGDEGPYDAQDAAPAPEEYESVPLTDSDELFSGYVQRLFGVDRTLYEARNLGGDLTGEKRALYSFMQNCVAEVAAGTRASTIFDYSYTGELCKEDCADVLFRLLADDPYEFYWFGNRYSISVYNGIAEIKLTVGSSYIAENKEFTIDTNKVSLARTAAANARDVVNQYADYSDYDKLVAYRDYICKSVSYNKEAVSGEWPKDTLDPWQLIWVFDGDPSTNVVCEGYAKAFQYLCDMSDFSGSVMCYCVTGLGNGGNHKWNIVRMPNGRNYLADITFCDQEKSGTYDWVFMKAPDSGDISQGYSFKVSKAVGTLSATYEYDQETWNIYTAADLTLSAGSYLVESGLAPEQRPATAPSRTSAATDSSPVVEYISESVSQDLPSDSPSSVTTTITTVVSTPPAIPIYGNTRATLTTAPGTVLKLDAVGTTGKKFKSSNKKVATVDQNGNVTFKKAGKVKITFKVGKKKRTVTLTVKDPTIPRSVTLSQSGTVAVKKGETTSLTATIPEGTNSGIKWKSSNKKVASVDQNGNVTFKKKGKVTITATATRGKKKAKVKFKVSK